MVEFCKDPENHEEGVKLGLFNKPIDVLSDIPVGNSSSNDNPIQSDS